MKAMFHARALVNAQGRTERQSQTVELAARVAEWAPTPKDAVARLADALTRQPIKRVKGKLVVASLREQQQIVRAVARIIGR